MDFLREGEGRSFIIALLILALLFYLIFRDRAEKRRD
jgi:hypothetical protein